MIKLILLIFFSLVSFGCNATSCVISEKSIIEQSKVYKSLVHIEVTKNNSLLTIVLNAPHEIRGNGITGVILHKEINDYGDNGFSIPLRFTVEEDKAIAWFNIDKKTAKHIFLSLDYGEDCGISIQYSIPL
ncbi:hypothetical protein OE749_17420 [Aestuariibacter sp. AA17]|uniref:Lipoprotein n=1 Tax=Fluctibacter corallii TaxID=2984329 RepID=A0ABT3ACX1_9ALTE|nr:hypothetical protein [Aestuariibacter sp. AA17]MCV2886479.1 hypothetical protein [Aestuariibacter sp. AA17]